MLSLDSYFLEVILPVSLKLTTKAPFGGKKNSEKSKSLGYTEKCDQKKLSFSDKLGMLMSGMDT